VLDSVTAQNVFVFNVRTNRQPNTLVCRKTDKHVNIYNLVLGANATCPITNRYDLG